MRLVCFVEDWLKQHPGEESERQLMAETGINSRMLRNLKRGDVNWSLKRNQVEELTLFAHRNGYPETFFFEYHPAWRTFDASPALIYRGAPNWDAEIEVDLIRFLKQMGGRPTSVTTPQSEEAIAAAMKETNCVFVGSPKSNPASEIATCLLSNAKPFNSRTTNRDKVPVHMLGVRPETGESAILIGGSVHGFSVRSENGSRKREVLDAHWLPPEEYEHWHDEAPDAAVILICRSPLGTTNSVTTIVVMGYSGLATASAMGQLIKGKAPFANVELRNGQLYVLGYHLQFRKLKRHGKSTEDPRRVLPKTISWWP